MRGECRRIHFCLTKFTEFFKFSNQVLKLKFLSWRSSRSERFLRRSLKLRSSMFRDMALISRRIVSLRASSELSASRHTRFLAWPHKNKSHQCRIPRRAQTGHVERLQDCIEQDRQLENCFLKTIFENFRPEILPGVEELRESSTSALAALSTPIFLIRKLSLDSSIVEYLLDRVHRWKLVTSRRKITVWWCL